jgi:copper chaperone
MKEERIVTMTYSVPGIHCDHCKAAVTRELEGVRGVQTVEVDLETKLVTVSGEGLEDTALVAAIDEAGYDAELISA